MGSMKTILITVLMLQLLIGGSQSCGCPPKSFRGHFCSSPFAIKGFVEHGEELWSDYGREWTRYTVNIEHVFRKPTDETLGEQIIISVPYQSSMCGMTLSEGQHYLLTGYIYPNDLEKYQVNACELTRYYHSLTAQQIAGISGGYGCGRV